MPTPDRPAGQIDVREALTGADAAEVASLVEAAARADGVTPLSEHVLLHLRYGDDPGARDLLLSDGGALAGFHHVGLRRSLVALTMTSAEREEFLAGLHVGILSVDDPGRGPLTVSVWYTYAPGETVNVITGGQSVKAQRLRAAGRFSLSAQTETVPYRYVSVEGPITAYDDTVAADERRAVAARGTLAPRAPSCISQRRSRMPGASPSAWRRHTGAPWTTGSNWVNSIHRRRQQHADGGRPGQHVPPVRSGWSHGRRGGALLVRAVRSWSGPCAACRGPSPGPVSPGPSSTPFRFMTIHFSGGATTVGPGGSDLGRGGLRWPAGAGRVRRASDGRPTWAKMC